MLIGLLFGLALPFQALSQLLCPEKTFTYKDLEVSYRLCDGLLTDTVYYYDNSKQPPRLLSKVCWQEGRVTSRHIDYSEWSEYLQYCETKFFNEIKVVDHEAFRQNIETKLTFKNLMMSSMSFRSKQAKVLLGKDRYSLRVIPHVPPGDTVVIDARLAGMKLFQIKEVVR